MISLEGEIKKIIYQNKETNYIVARFLPKGENNNINKSIVIVGNFHALNPSGYYMVKGEWVTHNTYGQQLKINSYEELMPTTLKGLEKYLASGLIKGIGPATAKKLVEKFKFDVLDILEVKPMKICEIPGIGKSKAENIAQSFQSQKELKNIIGYLSSYNIPVSLILKIHKYYGSQAHQILKNNPYQLAEDIWGIGFKTADKIALNLGLEKNSPERIKAGIIYLLKEATESGHLYLPKSELFKKSIEILECAENNIKNALTLLLKEEKILEENEEIFLKIFYQLEKKVAKRMKEFKYAPILPEPPADVWEKIFKNSSLIFDPYQLQALREIIKEGILIISGGPGTGKTTTIQNILKVAEELKQRAVLACPTGRAAKRLTEACGRQAKTIHRLLEYSPQIQNFKKNEENPLKADIIIIDEASMIDIFLFNSLLKAIPKESRLILIGDADQLPSVGPGNILKDLIKSKTVKTIFLKNIFRQKEGSLIIINSHRINQGEYPIFEKGSNDFVFLKITEPQEILNKIIQLYTKTIPEKLKLNPFSDIQILAPIHKGILGINNLNIELQKILNPPAPSKKEVRSIFFIFREGDKIMQIRNNYDKEVFNGDIGQIKTIDLEEQELLIEFTGPDGPFMVKYDFTELDEITLAYACTIHKSQGSEYPCVIMPITTQHYIMLNKNLIYTGITRAKKNVVLVGTPKALHIGIKNQKTDNRYTKLAERLKNSD